MPTQSGNYCKTAECTYSEWSASISVFVSTHLPRFASSNCNFKHFGLVQYYLAIYIFPRPKIPTTRQGCGTQCIPDLFIFPWSIYPFYFFFLPLPGGWIFLTLAFLTYGRCFRVRRRPSNCTQHIN